MLSLAKLCKEHGLRLHRDAAINSFGFIEIALQERLVFAMDRTNFDRAMTVDGVTAVLTTPELAACAGNADIGLATTIDPRRTFVDIHNSLVSSTDFYGATGPSRVDNTASVHPRAHVDEFGVTIGPRCRIDAGAVIQGGTRLEADVHVMAGAVLGSDGFQTMRFADRLVDIKHAGSLHIGAGTVIMANTVIARAVFRQSTRIGSDCRVGNGAFVSHNVSIDQRTLVGHGAVVAGNCRIGSDVTIGPGALCLDRLEVGNGAFVTAGAVVTKSVASGERVTGNFAVPHSDFLRALKRSVHTH